MSAYGFLGLGIMGTAMAGSLIREGFEVIVWNRSDDRVTPLCDLGASSAPTPREVIEQCDITFAMLSDDAAVREVCEEPDGVFSAVGPGHDFVNMSTIAAQTSEWVAEGVHAEGARFLEAPVSGSKKPAIDGQLVILAAGDESLFVDVAPAFNALGKRSYFLGHVGSGAKMKLVVNAIMGDAMVALAEGLSLAEKTGLDPSQVIEVLGDGAVASPMFALKGPLMLKHDFTPSFPLKHMRKDMRLVLELAREAEQPLPVTESAEEAFGRAQTQGHGDEDFSAVFEVVS